MNESLDRYRIAMEKSRASRLLPFAQPAQFRLRGGEAPAPSGGGPSEGSQNGPASALAPQRAFENNRIVALDPMRPESDLFRLLRTQVLQRLQARHARSVAVCSAVTGEGKTTISINLALSLSITVAHTVLLIDADLRAPSVAHCFGVPVIHGIEDYLSGMVDLQPCLIRPGIDRLILLPARAGVTGSSELLASPRMASLVQQLRALYPDAILIFDSPPLLLTDDCLAFLNQVETCLYVVEDGKTGSGDLVRALTLVPPEKFLGVVLNRAETRRRFG